MEVVENQSIATVGAQKNMKMSEREIAIYKVSEVAKVIESLRSGSGSLPELWDQLTELVGDGDATMLWGIVEPHLKAHHIVIRKPTERPVSLDDLPGMEILKRAEFRSCHDALCPKASHCTECGLCERRNNDGHLCRCQVCGLEYISSASGDEHNLDGECKESSE